MEHNYRVLGTGRIFSFLPNAFKLFGFPIFPLSAYITKVIRWVWRLRFQYNRIVNTYLDIYVFCKEL